MVKKRGCSGFIRYNDNIVYIDTERYCNGAYNYLHRFARDEKDSCGGYNHFAENEEGFVEDVVKMLVTGKEYI